MNKIYLIGIVLVVLLASPALAGTVFTKNFENNSCAEWALCQSTTNRVLNGTYSGNNTLSSGPTFSNAWANISGNYNASFTLYHLAPSSYYTFGLATAGNQYEGQGAVLRIISTSGFYKYYSQAAGDFVDTAIPRYDGVATRWIYEFNGSGGHFNVYVNGTLMLSNIDFRNITFGNLEKNDTRVFEFYNPGADQVFTFDDLTIQDRNVVVSPSTSPLNLSQPYPLNLTSFVNSTLNFNLTVNASNSFTISLMINGTHNSTRAFNAGQNVYVNFNVSLADGNYRYSFNASDGANTTSTGNFTFFVDTGPPITVLSRSLNGMVSFGNTNISMQINLTDDNVWGLNVTVDDSIIIFNVTGLNVAFYQKNITFNPRDYGITPGVHILNIWSSDSHTAVEIPDYEYTRNPISKSLKYDFGQDWIKIEPLNRGLFSDLSTWKDKDRYIFEFDRDLIAKLMHGDDMEFEVTSSSKLEIANTGYDGHIVASNIEKWVDFETGDNDAVVTSEQVNENTVRVLIKNVGEDTVRFRSLGGTNVLNVNYTFYYGNLSETYTNQSLETDSALFSLNFSKNDTYVNDVNATFYYNGTPYVPTKETATNYIMFTQNVETGLLGLNVTNISFYWRYNVMVTNSSNFTNETTHLNQSRYAMVITNCSPTLSNVIAFNFTTENKSGIKLDTTSEALFTVWNRSAALSRSYPSADVSKNSHTYCVAPDFARFLGNMEVRFSATGYDDRTYTRVNADMNISNRNVTIMMDLAVDTTTINVKIVDENEIELNGYFVEAYRYDLGTNSYSLVDTKVSNSAGNTVFDLDVSSDEYSFRVKSPSGVTVYDEPKQKLTATSYVFRIILGTSSESTILRLRNLPWALSVDNSYKSANLTWDDTATGLINSINLTIYRSNNGSNEIVSNQQSTTNSGSMGYNVSASGIYVVSVFVVATEDGVQYYLGGDTIDVREAWDVFGPEALFMSFFFLGTIIFLGLFYSAEAGLILGIIGLFTFVMLGFLMVSVAAMVAIIISIIFIIVRLEKR